MRKNVIRYTVRNEDVMSDLYNELRTQIARILVEINSLELADPEHRSRLWLEEERTHVESDHQSTNMRIGALIRGGKISADAATSFLNDSHYAYGAMRELIEAACTYYVERDSAVAEVEQIIAMDDDELEAYATETSTKTEDAHTV